MKVRAEIAGQDWISAEKIGGAWAIEARGCSHLLMRLREVSAHNKNPETWPLPEGQHHVDFLLKEFILKTRQQWVFPYLEAEICHCRKVTTATVDRAIMNGALTAVQVTRCTSASSSCGTCRSDVQKIIDYRIGPIAKPAQKKTAA